MADGNGPSPNSRRKSSRMSMSSASIDMSADDGRAVDTAAMNSDSIKVVCRFRPIRVNARQSSTAESSFSLNSSTGEVECVSSYADRKVFKFDKVNEERK